MGITIAVTVGIGVLLGIWADNAWGSAPLWLVIGLVLGTVAAVVSVKQQIRRFL
jgi:F0F1-type ATP synthase assembly protein I